MSKAWHASSMMQKSKLRSSNWRPPAPWHVDMTIRDRFSTVEARARSRFRNSLRSSRTCSHMRRRSSPFTRGALRALLFPARGAPRGGESTCIRSSISCATSRASWPSDECRLCTSSVARVSDGNTRAGCPIRVTCASIRARASLYSGAKTRSNRLSTARLLAPHTRMRACG